MRFSEVLSKTRNVFSGLNEPASEKNLSKLTNEFGPLPDDALAVYRDHDGANNLPESLTRRAFARLMPVDEVISTCDRLRALTTIPAIDQVCLLWTDDNSNYCGVFTEGPLKNYLAVLDHEEPILAPAFRSIPSFMSRLIDEACEPNGDSSVCDLPSLKRETPELVANEKTAADDLLLASKLTGLYTATTDEGLRRFYAICSICLTPFGRSEDTFPFLQADDMWIPEAAVNLLEARHWKGCVAQLEVLAREGHPNGDSAAMRLLARMKNEESSQAIERLRGALHGQKLQTLEMWNTVSLKPLR